MQQTPSTVYSLKTPSLHLPLSPESLPDENSPEADCNRSTLFDINSTDYPKDSNGIPIPQSFADLLKFIRLEMGVYGLVDKEVNIPRLQQIIQNYQSNPEEWKKFCFFDEYRYTRNLVDNGNGKYNLLLLCWGPSHASPIHDHAGSHCILKVMDGQLTETLFDWPTGNQDKTRMKPSRIISMAKDQAGYMHDKLGLHRVSNNSASSGAVSLHLYSPPINVCTTFCEETGNARKSGNCVFYSVAGERTKSCSAGLN